ncbi:MAG: hypothetical protein QOH73_1347 [Gaiellaceae bacterium]|nr:hypothetical protein [Gaiellaceae bacterium]
MELGFEGGGVLRCDVASEAFEALLTAFAAGERSAIELTVDGARAMVDLRRVLFVRQRRAGGAISFAE